MMNVKGLLGDLLFGAFSPLCQAFNSSDSKGGLDFVNQMEAAPLAEDLLCETASAITDSCSTTLTTTNEVVSNAGALLTSSCAASVETDSKSQVGAILTVGLASACVYLLSKAVTPPVFAPLPATGPPITLNHINVRVAEFVQAPFSEQKKFLDRMIPLTLIANSTEPKMACLVCEEAACVRTYPCTHTVACSECDYVWEISMLQTKIQQLRIDPNVIMDPAFFATHKIPQCMLCRSKIASRVCLN